MNNRKGSTASVSSLASSSASSINGSTNQKLIDFSIDDVFARYTVPQVQKLQSKYYSDIATAKDELHSLVGGKYRDLVRIAEEIDSMSDTAHKIDDSLTDMSFRSSSYVAFGNNNFSKFNSSMRKEKVALARHQSKNTILNNIINNELISYDLKLQTGSLKNTKTLVHLAKIYYTIEKLFSDRLRSNVHGVSRYYMLKGNFLAHLEKKIATYTFFDDSMSSNSNSLDVNGLIQNSETKQWLESDSLDFDGEFYNDDDFNSSENDSTESDSLGASIKPIVNYLLAYLIARSEEDKPMSIKAKVIDLKLAYLHTLIKESLKHPRASNISFYKILRFIEATAICINDYITHDGELLTRLAQIKSWKASQLIGFHNWFEVDEIHFESPIDTAADSEVLLNDYYRNCRHCLQSFASELYKCSARSDDVADTITIVLSVLFNFFAGATKVKDLARFEERSCYIIGGIFTKNLLTSFVSSAISTIKQVSEIHSQNLTQCIIAEVISSLNADSTETNHDDEYFSSDLIGFMDKDIEKYLKRVSQLGSFKAIGKNALDDSLKMWLVLTEKLIDETNISSDNMVRKINSQLEKASHVAVFGFQRKEFADQIQMFRSSIEENTVKQLEDFIAELFKMVQAQKRANKDLNLGVLGLMLEVKVFVNKYPENESLRVVDAKVGEVVAKLYDNLLDCTFHSKLDSIALRSQLTEAISNSSGENPTERPQRAQLAVHSVLFGVVEELLDSDRFEQQYVLSYFTHKAVSELFRERKEKYLLTIIEEALQHYCDSSDKENSNGENGTASSKNETNNTDESSSNKSSTLEAELVFANILFVYSFTKSSAIENDDFLKTCLCKILDATQVEDSTIELISRGVSEQFRATKNLFLPLSVV
ncbi:hypothetical_protein [Candidozyma auris]|uniref:hypothetical_protein n=1 Tax=Candidozyma auris TaxID=498019 RepID=UPI000D2B2E39|nr:hypothetical_protein [[Candida] auris]QEO19293.1 hypothetical_protein [[Candida] auris]